jgi:hypothetical protein
MEKILKRCEVVEMKSVMKCTLKALPWAFFLFSLIILQLIVFKLATHEKTFTDLNWQIIPTPDSSADIIRMSVPHGWLVAYKSVSRGLVYIPDDKHEWKFNHKATAVIHE